MLQLALSSGLLLRQCIYFLLWSSARGLVHWWRQNRDGQPEGVDVFYFVYCLCSDAVWNKSTLILWCRHLWTCEAGTGAVAWCRKPTAYRDVRTLNGRFRNTSILPEAVVHTCIQYHSSSGPLCTRCFACITISTIPSHHGGIFIYLTTGTRRRSCSSFDFITFWPCCPCPRTLVVDHCWRASILVWNYMGLILVREGRCPLQTCR